jgi:hypothetical protein
MPKWQKNIILLIILSKLFFVEYSIRELAILILLFALYFAFG